MTQTTAQIESLVRQNARACEQARRPHCKCPCKGKLRKKPHPEEWIQGVVAGLSGEEEVDVAHLTSGVLAVLRDDAK